MGPLSQRDRKDIDIARNVVKDKFAAMRLKELAGTASLVFLSRYQIHFINNEQSYECVFFILK